MIYIYAYRILPITTTKKDQQRPKCQEGMNNSGLIFLRKKKRAAVVEFPNRFNAVRLARGASRRLHATLNAPLDSKDAPSAHRSWVKCLKAHQPEILT